MVADQLGRVGIDQACITIGDSITAEIAFACQEIREVAIRTGCTIDIGVGTCAGKTVGKIDITKVTVVLRIQIIRIITGVARQGI